MTEAYLFATAGFGPDECHLALEGILKQLESEALHSGLSIEISTALHRMGVASALIAISGQGALGFASTWIGTVQWQCPSPIRSTHRRKNWFVGIFATSVPPELGDAVDIAQVQFESFRAGGPGGQHQNTTDSAVRARWRGFVAVSRSERSQHRNKAKALERLNALVSQVAGNANELAVNAQHDLHNQLQRGNPVKRFKGPKFKPF